MRYLLAILVLLSQSAWGADYTIYFSTTNSAAGDGTVGNPYKALASAPWATITNLSAGGTNVYLSLQRGSVFREQWTFSGFGAGANPICVIDYAGTNTAKPVISGANVITTWTVYSGSTYQATASFTPSGLRVNGEILTRGPSKDVLRPSEYTNETSTVYLRWDAGDPDDLGLLVEGTERTYCTSESGGARDNVRFTNIVFQAAGTAIVRMAGTSTDNRIYDGCEFDSGGGTAIWGKSTNTIWSACRFTGNIATAGITGYTNGSTGKFLFCLFDGIDTGYSSAVSNNVDFVNCTFVRTGSRAINNSGTGAILRADNCVFAAHGRKLTTAGNAVLENANGSLTINNCSVLISPHDFSLRPVGVTYGAGNMIRDPQFVQPKNFGIYSVTMDDIPTMDTYGLRSAQAGNPSGYYVGAALFEEGWTTSYQSNAQVFIRLGNEIAHHTRDHMNITNFNAFRIWYVGSGSSCLLSVSASNMTTSVTGAEADNLSLDLTHADYVKQNDLMVYINGLAGYNASNISSTAYGGTVPSCLITNLTDVELKPGPYVIPYDYGLTFTNQIESWTTQMEGYWTNANGSAYDVRTIYYPFGGYSDSMIYALTNIGIIGGRSINPIATSRNYLGTKDYFNTMAWPIQKSPYQQSALLRYENGLTEENGKTFTGSNVTYTTTGVYESIYSAVFNGTSTAVFTDDHADFNFSDRDWMVSMTVTPTAISGTNTLYYQETDGDNFARIALLADGSIQLLVVSNAAAVVTASSGAGYTAAGRQTRIAVQQRDNDVWFFTNWVKVASATTTRGPTDYTGKVFVGMTFGGTSYFNGVMDLFEVLLHPWQNAASLASTFSEVGFVASMYQHNEYSLSVDQMRNCWDALTENGSVISPTIGNAATMFRTNGVSTDGLYYAWTTTYTPDYSLKTTSPLINAGRTNLVTGTPLLRDYAGTAVTDASGTLTRGSITIGSYDSLPSGTTPPLDTVVPVIQFINVGTLNVDNPISP